EHELRGRGAGDDRHAANDDGGGHAARLTLQRDQVGIVFVALHFQPAGNPQAITPRCRFEALVLLAFEQEFAEVLCDGNTARQQPAGGDKERRSDEPHVQNRSVGHTSPMATRVSFPEASASVRAKASSIPLTIPSTIPLCEKS